MREIYLETISNIANDIENFEKITTWIESEDIDFSIATLSVFQNFIVYPYKDSMKISGKQKTTGLILSKKKNLKLYGLI